MVRSETLYFILHNVVAAYLRKFFKHQWDHLYPTPWQDNTTSLNNFLNLQKNKKSANNSLTNSGNRDDWDLTALFFALLRSDFLGTSLQSSGYYIAICRLKDIRNNLSHPSSNTYMTKDDFNQTCKQIVRCLRDLGFHDAYREVDDVIQELHPNSPSTQDDGEYCCRIENTDAACNLPGISHTKCKPSLKIRFWQFLTIIILFTTFIATFFLIRHFLYANTEKPRRKFVLKSTRRPIMLDAPIKTHFYFPEAMLPKNFMGRDQEIFKILGYIQNDTSGMVTIEGHQSIGRTSLSLAAGLELQHSGYSVAYSKFEKGQSISSALLTISKSVLTNTHTDTYTIFAKLEQIVKTTKVLLILDDIDNLIVTDDRTGTAKMLAKFNQIPSLKMIIITSSHHWIHESVNSCAPTMHVDALTSTTSSDLLLSICPEMSHETAIHIALTIPRIPLLLEILGSHFCAKPYILNYKTFARETKYLWEGIDARDSSTFYPLLLNLYLKLSLREQIEFLHIGIHGSALRPNGHSIHRLLHLRLLKRVPIPDDEPKLEMHPILKDFATSIGEEFLYLLQLADEHMFVVIFLILCGLLFLGLASRMLQGTSSLHRHIIWSMSCSLMYVYLYMLNILCFIFLISHNHKSILGDAYLFHTCTISVIILSGLEVYLRKGGIGNMNISYRWKTYLRESIICIALYIISHISSGICIALLLQQGDDNMFVMLFVLSVSGGFTFQRIAWVRKPIRNFAQDCVDWVHLWMSIFMYTFGIVWIFYCVSSTFPGYNIMHMIGYVQIVPLFFNTLVFYALSKVLLWQQRK